MSLVGHSSTSLQNFGTVHITHHHGDNFDMVPGDNDLVAPSYMSLAHRDV